MSIVTDHNKYLQIIIFMWVGNAILFVGSALTQNYAQHIDAWYEPAFQVFAFGFGMSKIVLSILLLVAVWNRTHSSPIS